MENIVKWNTYLFINKQFINISSHVNENEK